jgi:putative endonuclease
MFHTYIVASGRNGTLYIGMTDSLSRRVLEHRSGAIPGFTRRYGVSRLVWYAGFETREGAFARERAMKKWNRRWKLELIERFNPGWRDLFEDLEAE